MMADIFDKDDARLYRSIAPALRLKASAYRAVDISEMTSAARRAANFAAR